MRLKSQVRLGYELSGESGRGVCFITEGSSTEEAEQGQLLKVCSVETSMGTANQTRSVLSQRWWPNVRATEMGCESPWDAQTCAGCGERGVRLAVGGCGYRRRGGVEGEEGGGGGRGGEKGRRREDKVPIFEKPVLLEKPENLMTTEPSPKFRSGDKRCVVPQAGGGRGWLEHGWRKQEGKLPGGEETSGGFGETEGTAGTH